MTTQREGSKHWNTWGLGIFAALFAALTASVACAQGSTRSNATLAVKTVLVPLEAGKSSTSPAVVLWRRSQYPPHKIDSLVTELERLSLAAPSEVARMSAAQALTVAGVGATPLQGAFDRIVAIYRRSSDGLVRRTILSQMSNQAERQRALQFLEGVAREKREAQDFEQASWLAVQTLSYMGREGRYVLSRLKRDGTLTDAAARGYVDWFLKER